MTNPTTGVYAPKITDGATNGPTYYARQLVSINTTHDGFGGVIVFAQFNDGTLWVNTNPREDTTEDDWTQITLPLHATAKP